MPLHRSSVVCQIPALSCVLVLAASVTWAQDNPSPADTARFQFGPLGLTPTLTVSSGLDSNIFNHGTDERQDLTTQVRSVLQTALTARRARFLATTRGEYSFFREYRNQRGLSLSNRLRADVELHRVRPYIAGAYTNARERPSLEIDTRVRRRELAVGGGFDLKMSQKLTFTTGVERTELEFDDSAVEEGLRLGDALNRTAESLTSALEYQATPLTRFLLTTDLRRERFVSDAGIENLSLRLAPGVDFSPFALISGRAEVGLLRFESGDPQVPAFSGALASVNLSYVLLGATKFTLRVANDISYSALAPSVYYVQRGLGLTASRLVGERLVLRGSSDWYRLDYRLRDGFLPGQTTQRGLGPAVVNSYLTEIDYRLGRFTHLRVTGEFYRRTSEVRINDFDRFRLVTSISYGS